MKDLKKEQIEEEKLNLNKDNFDVEEFKKFLKNNPKDYDFVNDCLDNLNKNIKNKYQNVTGEVNDIVIKKFILYKTYKLDPDIDSKLLQEIYRKKWNFISNKWFMHNKMEESSEEWICSDTMTSVLMLINRAMELYDNEIDVNKRKGKKIKEIDGIWGKNQKRYSMIVFQKAYESKDKNIIKKLFEDCNICELIKIYHTIGNYCPVPCFFNGARSGNGAEHDFWDLTLMEIRKYYIYCDGSEQSLAKILGGLLHNKGNICTCKAWLDSFGKGEDGWNNFIKKNYFSVYVDENTKEVKPLWEGHSWEEPLPKNLYDLKNGVDELVKRINERGNTICEELKKES